MTDDEKLQRLVQFARDCLDPERFGWAVSEEVREAARKALKGDGDQSG